MKILSQTNLNPMQKSDAESMAQSGTKRHNKAALDSTVVPIPKCRRRRGRGDYYPDSKGVPVVMEWSPNPEMQCELHV